MAISREGGGMRSIGLVLAAALAASGCAAAKTGPFLLHPLPPQLQNYSLAAGAVTYADERVTVEVRPLDPRWVAKTLAAAGEENPFAPPGEGKPTPLIFEVFLRATGKAAVYFNPGLVRGIDDRQRRYYPMSYTDFYQMLRDEARGEAKLKSFTRIAYDTPVQLQPGGEIRKYLPLAVLDEVPKTLAISLPVKTGTAENLFAFLFEAFPAGKEDSAP